ncbi:MAG: hypothetical protein R3B13_07935 [Polyangiaceae bacterium]
METSAKTRFTCSRFCNRAGSAGDLHGSSSATQIRTMHGPRVRMARHGERVCIVIGADHGGADLVTVNVTQIAGGAGRGAEWRDPNQSSSGGIVGCAALDV